MDDEEIQHLLKVRKATQARIWVLEQRKAERGELDTGHAVELQQARVDIRTLDARLQAPTPSRAVSDLIPDASLLHLQLQFASFVQRFDDALIFITHGMEEMHGSVADLKEHDEKEAEERKIGQARTAKQYRRIWRSMAGLAFVVVLVCSMFLYILWRLFW